MTKPKTKKGARKKFRLSHVKTPQLGGYFAFTHYVWNYCWSEKRLLGKLLLTYIVTALLIAGAVSQEDYRMVSDELAASVDEAGGGGFLTTAFLYGATVSGSIGVDVSGLLPQLGLAIAFVVWLVTIWLLRQRILDRAVQVRDGVYNGLAPLISSLLLFVLGLLQLLPMAIAVLVLSAAMSSGILQGPVFVPLFVLATILMTLLSLYWLAATVMSLVVVTLPGTYPLAAHRLARNIVAGRRITVIGRIAWLLALIALFSMIVLIPVIIIDSAVKSAWLPLVPFMSQVVTSASVLFGAVYIYLLYRKMIGNGESSS